MKKGRGGSAASDRVRLLGLSPAELAAASRERMLALETAEMIAVRDHFREKGRDPTLLEMETIAQTWSEHCVHKTLRGIIHYEEDGRRETIDNLLRETIFRATRELDREFCLSVFKDNAGIVAFNEKWALAFKVETHNHPSALEPYGGAATGVGGVIRDILGAGLGARPVLNTDVFCFGPADTCPGELPESVQHPRRIFRGVVSGVRDYGNRMGIPTASGAILFDPGYRQNPLVFCGTLGLIPRDRIEKKVHPGDLVVLAGGRTGRDGIHGATFSSLSLKRGIDSQVVQIGAPITEKKLLEAVLRARDLGLFRSVTDCGAGGLSSAVGELGAETGALVRLEEVPLKYPGLEPWEIWVSEAQERMVLVVPPECREALAAVFAAEEVEAAVIGEFTGDGLLRVLHRERLAGEIEMSFLHHGLPRKEMKAVYRSRRPARPALPPGLDPGRVLRKLLAHPNISSREKIIRQYDHEVQGQTAVKPLNGNGGPSDAVIIRPMREDPARGIVVSCGINLYGKTDPAASASHAVDEALRNLCAVGGDPGRAALLDNFCWGDVSDPEQLGALVRSARACCRSALDYGTPFISGKDSLNNCFVTRSGRRLSIPPTLLISAVSTIPDIERAVTSDFKNEGGAIFLVGENRPETGGSHFAAVTGLAEGPVPPVDAPLNRRVMAALHEAIGQGLVAACHDLSEGGLAVALAEMCFGEKTGAAIDLRQVPAGGCDRDEQLLFCEAAGRFLVEVAPGGEGGFRRLFGNLPAAGIGRVSGNGRLEVVGPGGREVLSEDCRALRDAWREALDP